MTSRFPPNLGKIATSPYKIIAGDSQTHIILGSGTQTRFGVLHRATDARGKLEEHGKSVRSARVDSRERVTLIFSVLSPNFPNILTKSVASPSISRAPREIRWVSPKLRSIKQRS